MKDRWTIRDGMPAWDEIRAREELIARVNIEPELDSPEERDRAFALGRFRAAQAGEICLEPEYLQHAYRAERRGEATPKQRLSLLVCWPHERDSIQKAADEEDRREAEVARDVAEHGEKAVEWHRTMGQERYLPPEAHEPKPAPMPTNGERAHSTSRPKGGRAAGSSSRTSRGSPDDDDGGDGDPPGGPPPPHPEPYEVPRQGFKPVQLALFEGRAR